MVKPKKHLGQHFLRNDEICARVSDAVSRSQTKRQVLEIGPGTGALTKHLLQRDDLQVDVVEVDHESVDFLNAHYPELKGRIHERDFLQMPLDELFPTPLVVAGNFPYNISSQILFKVLDHKDQVTEIVGMFQREVAERVAADSGGRDRGILSVLIQAFYTVEYLFTVDENEFFPPPKVKSGVIRIVRNDVKTLPVDEKFFKTLVKTGFNQRRKTLRNSVKGVNGYHADLPFMDKRPEQLSVNQWLELAAAFL
jgi:16S rRNA (adenine1518-N6/adenine1519-N6)-dimethyltransferase